MGKSTLLSIFRSYSEQETINFASDFATELKGGEIILLSGPIGAGKTVFVKGLAQGLFCDKIPISSSFNIMRLYKGKLNIRHYDLFRISEREIDDLDFYSSQDNEIIVIEWPKAAKKFYSRYPYIDIKILLKEGDERIIKVMRKN